MSLPLAQLSSLDLIRGFVAIGRRMSITLAARDLCLTQSAVSRQVHSLEDTLGVKLFVRHYRAIAFTPEGERLFRCADSAVQQLQDVIGALRGTATHLPVNITASIGVAGLWLMPRLGAFLQHHPGIDLRVSANNRIEDLRNEGLDLSIRYCTQDAAPENAIRLFSETVGPVAHPSLGLTALNGPKILERQILLEYDGPYRPWLQWPEWLARQGWGNVKAKSVLRFNHYDQLIHAAVAGEGVALGRLELISLMLADRRLIVLDAPQKGPETSHAHWLIHADPSPRNDVRDVMHWIEAEAKISGNLSLPVSRPGRSNRKIKAGGL